MFQYNSPSLRRDSHSLFPSLIFFATAKDSSKSFIDSSNLPSLLNFSANVKSWEYSFSNSTLLREKSSGLKK